MADHFQLRIVTPLRLALDDEVTEVTAPGTAGEFGVLPRHTTFLSTLEAGVLQYKTDIGSYAAAIRGGFAEVNDDVMTVLADAAEFPNEVDVAKAEADLRDALARLTKLTALDEQHAAAEADKAWAEARLQVARRG